MHDESKINRKKRVFRSALYGGAPNGWLLNSVATHTCTPQRIVQTISNPGQLGNLEDLWSKDQCVEGKILFINQRSNTQRRFND
jgi:hypothetical protein